MKRFKSILDVAVTLLVITAASLVIWRQLAPGGRSQGRSPVESVSGTLGADLSTHVRGTGPVALVEFADFECPFCGRHARDVDPMLQKAFVSTGVVRQMFVHLPLSSHARAKPASAAAICAGVQGKFWEMHDALFLDQAALAEGDLADRARGLGLDSRLFSECVSGGLQRALIERHISVARDLGVQSTPAFLLGLVQADGSVTLKKRINGALPFHEFRSAIMDVAPSEIFGCWEYEGGTIATGQCFG